VQVHYQEGFYQLHPGDIAIYQTDTVLGMKPMSSTWSYHLLRVSPNMLHHYMPTHDIGSAYEQLGKTCEVPATSECYEATLEMFEKFNRSRSGFKEHLRRFVVQLAGHLQEVLLFSEPLGQDSVLVDHVKTHMQTNYARTVSYKELCTLNGSSKSHILRSFKKVVGVTPHLYQTSWRVKAAKGLLRSNVPIASVAVEVGFADQPHFTRIFKRHVGVTPGQYQQSLTNELHLAA